MSRDHPSEDHPLPSTPARPASSDLLKTGSCGSHTMRGPTGNALHITNPRRRRHRHVTHHAACHACSVPCPLPRRQRDHGCGHRRRRSVCAHARLRRDARRPLQEPAGRRCITLGLTMLMHDHAVAHADAHAGAQGTVHAIAHGKVHCHRALSSRTPSRMAHSAWHSACTVHGTVHAQCMARCTPQW